MSRSPPDEDQPAADLKHELVHTYVRLRPVSRHPSLFPGLEINDAELARDRREGWCRRAIHKQTIVRRKSCPEDCAAGAHNALLRPQAFLYFLFYSFRIP